MLTRIWQKLKEELPSNYEPSEGEPFMSPQQLAYFRHKLESWRVELLQSAAQTLENLKQEEKRQPDISDQASQQIDRNLELRERARQRKLLAKIEQALFKIKNGTYGYCEETGEPIAIKRLIARPIANFTIEAQEKHELDEKIHSKN